MFYTAAGCGASFLLGSERWLTEHRFYVVLSSDVIKSARSEHEIEDTMMGGRGCQQLPLSALFSLVLQTILLLDCSGTGSKASLEMSYCDKVRWNVYLITPIPTCSWKESVFYMCLHTDFPSGSLPYLFCSFWHWSAKPNTFGSLWYKLLKLKCMENWNLIDSSL